MFTLKASQARIPTEAFNRVIYNRERIRIQHRSAGSAVLVSEEDAALLEELEDRADVEAARKALRRMRKRGEKPIPYEEARKQLGLD